MRRPGRKRLESIWIEIARNPGIRPGRVAARLGIPRSSVWRVLPAMDAQGLLLSEDRSGGLWVWRRRNGSGLVVSAGSVAFSRDDYDTIGTMTSPTHEEEGDATSHEQSGTIAADRIALAGLS